MAETVGIVEVSKPSEIRAYVRPELKRLIKAIAGLKNTNRDWTISDCVIEALELWLQQPEQQELIRKHSLDSESESS
jgi:hypothetical protein